MKKEQTIATILLIVLFFFNFFVMFSGSGTHDLAEDKMPRWLSLPFQLALIFVSWYSAFSCRHKYGNLSKYFLILIVFAFINGMLHGGGNGNISLTMDFLTCLMIVIGVLLVDVDEKKITKFVLYTAICAIVFSLYDLAHFDASMLATLISMRAQLWGESIFFTATLFWFLWFLIIYAFVYKKYYWIAIISWLIFFVIEMIATKRIFIVQTGWTIVILLLFFHKTHQKKAFKSLIWVAVLAFVGVSLVISKSDIDFSSLFEAQENRMSSVEIEDTGFLRFRESSNYLSRASVIDIFMGKGLATKHFGHPGNQTLTALHIGVTNILFKFGFWMLIPYIIFLYRMLGNIKRIRYLYLNDKFGLTCLLTALVQAPVFLLVGNYWSLSPALAFFWFCLLRSTVNNHKPALS